MAVSKPIDNGTAPVPPYDEPKIWESALDLNALRESAMKSQN
jgi:hypothetical protein